MKYFFFLCLASVLVAQEAPKAAAAATGNKSIIVIEPKARAQDYIQAFDQLRKDKPTLKIMVRLTNGVALTVSELSATSGGTLLLMKSLSSQGTRIQVVPVEEIMEITYSP